MDSDATHVYRVSSYKACVYYHLTMWVLLGNTTFLLNEIVRIASIIRVVGIIRGRAFYEEIQYSFKNKCPAKKSADSST